MVVPDDVDLETFASSTDFAQVVTTIKALASEDERIVEHLRVISAGKIPSSGGQIDVQLSEVLSEKVEAAVFLENLKLKVWDRVAKLNWKPFKEVRAFVRRLGLRNRPDWNAYIENELPNVKPCREDWGLTWNMILDTGGLLVSKQIRLEIEVELIRQNP